MKRITYLLISFVFFGCQSSPKTQPEKTNSETDNSSTTDFKLPEIPMTIVEPEARATYLAANYWSNFDIQNQQLKTDTTNFEQLYSNYLLFLREGEQINFCTTINKCITHFNTDSLYLNRLYQLSEKYLYDPNSPFRNDEYYLCFINSLLETNKLSFGDSTRLAYQQELVSKNRIGHKASNFEYKTIKNKSTLYNIKSPYTLVFFYNPDCHACKEIKLDLENSNSINSLVNNKRLTILAVYTDEELDLWEHSVNEYPQNWIVSYNPDSKIKMNQMYDLKAIPTLYLLDNNKQVLLKDATIEQINKYFDFQTNF
ncbi:MAG: DUF5106 domain-containing protein [Bacteroidales bacterium]